ncbi:bifunctional homocysteine S-methyltransferase/methylenetetrahydrofolate reductase, partial [bacterium]|nr:bifunctional homocysteine S-methyltransferase/methylenetetrahydrofolate reductase [bacterium]
MSPVDLMALLRQGKTLLADGAMGTELHRRSGAPIAACFELLNVEQPEVVESIHRDYLAAGAQMIETNT